jgi:hypothetical protein
MGGRRNASRLENRFNISNTQKNVVKIKVEIIGE